MATLALSLGGQVVGGLLGGPIGATVGRALGALAGSAIDGMLFGEPQTAAAPGEMRLQGSREGAPIPRVYGWTRLTGNVVWATELVDIEPEDAGAKGLFAADDGATPIAANFALALCEGEVHRIGRIWADGNLLATEGLNIRIYRGTEDQPVDGLIAATQGEGGAPAYRGVCYLVFERLPLASFGNRIPNLSVEVCRAVGELEPAIRAVTVIPGATEFGYDPVPRLRIVRPGETTGENVHQLPDTSDWTVSMDELTAICPNLEDVSLVVTWFGDDLRCGSCAIRPRVEASSRTVDGVDWSVAGVSRGTATVVSSHAGGPAYGGTPSDASVLAAIADLKARGLRVTLYPLVMMDVPEGNALPDPYGGTAQAAYPWRGRITCHPAPGRGGSPDGTGTATAQVDAFFAATWGYRRMVLHYAALAAEGGADALVIGSELRGLTTVRGMGDSFPAVTRLMTLASDVRAIVGPTVKLTYAADWSEYSGYQPGGGAKLFHLDPLWAHAAIDAVGIDNYMPIADWRDGTDHADAQVTGSVYDLDYLAANIAGGEGFHWFYASDADRVAGQRTPVTDGGAGEPWVWRYKDLVSWWSQLHYDRPGGVRAATPTAWVPQGKPIWFTELGCAAVDKGANQPNLFSDAKSSEDGRPYFSSGAPDALMQRQFLRAHHRWWNDPQNNPASTVYSGRMVDTGHTALWTWDARPYPAFPTLAETWADGVNHAAGHWLTGRLGALAADELAEALADDFGVAIDAQPRPPLLHGMVVEQVGTLRDALAPVMTTCGIDLVGRDGELKLITPDLREPCLLGERVAGEGPIETCRRADPTATVGRLAVGFSDRERSYLQGTVTASREGEAALATETLPLTLDAAGARLAAERMLAQRAGSTTGELTLPPSALALEAGDVVDLGGTDGLRVVTEIRDALARRVSVRALAGEAATEFDEARPALHPTLPGGRAIPVTWSAHLPAMAEDPLRSRLLVAAWARPWPGEVTVVDGIAGTTLATVTQPATIGTVAEALPPGPTALPDPVSTLTVALNTGHLSDAEPAAVLAGANRVAVETAGGDWEVVGFEGAELVMPGLYRLSGLFRGLDGTEHAVVGAGIGNRVIVLDGRYTVLPLSADALDRERELRVFGGRTDLVGMPLELALPVGAALPLAPVHLAARRLANGDIRFGWARRSRGDASHWGLAEAVLEHAPETYRLTILDAGVPRRTIDAASPVAVYSATAQAADFGGPATVCNWTVAQCSAVLGPGHAASAAFSG